MSQLGLPLSDETGGHRHRSRRARRHHERRRKRSGHAAAFFAFVVVVAVIAGLFFGGRALLQRVMPEEEQDYAGPGTGEVTVVVQPGDSLRAIGRTLEEADAISSVNAFLDAAAGEPRANRIFPGTYRLMLKMPGADALAMLLDPASRITTRVTVPEGQRVEEVVAALAKGTGIAAADFEAALAQPDAIGLPDYAKGKAEGYLFPATYQIDPGSTAVSILKQMTARFAQAAAKVKLEANASKVGLTPAEVVVVASIIEAEAQRPDDYFKVSRVIYNRLDAGMRLQMDSTVNFATGKHGVTTTAQDRASTSPYNTYGVAGLPPGPIDSPGEQALEAALNPAAGSWLYFVAVNPDTGETRFAVTAAEHQANVQLFQQWLRNKR